MFKKHCYESNEEKTESKFTSWFFLTPAETFVFMMAGFVVWVAKAQDRAMEKAGYTLHQTKPKREVSAASVYIPSLGYRKEQPVMVQREIPLGDAYSDVEVPALPPEPEEAPVIEEVSTEERVFYRRYAESLRLTQSRKLTEDEMNAMLKNAAVSFSFVEDIFQSASRRPRNEIVLSEVLRNAVLRQQVFGAIEQRFGIPARESAIFSKSHGLRLSDWAMFVEQQQR